MIGRTVRWILDNGVPRRAIRCGPLVTPSRHGRSADVACRRRAPLERSRLCPGYSADTTAMHGDAPVAGLCHSQGIHTGGCKSPAALALARNPRPPGSQTAGGLGCAAATTAALPGRRHAWRPAAGGPPSQPPDGGSRHSPLQRAPAFEHPEVHNSSPCMASSLCWCASSARSSWSRAAHSAWGGRGGRGTAQAVRHPQQRRLYTGCMQRAVAERLQAACRQPRTCTYRHPRLEMTARCTAAHLEGRCRLSAPRLHRAARRVHARRLHRLPPQRRAPRRSHLALRCRRRAHPLCSFCAQGPAQVEVWAWRASRQAAAGQLSTQQHCRQPDASGPSPWPESMTRLPTRYCASLRPTCGPPCKPPPAHPSQGWRAPAAAAARARATPAATARTARTRSPDDTRHRRCCSGRRSRRHQHSCAGGRAAARSAAGCWRRDATPTDPRRRAPHTRGRCRRRHHAGACV